MAGATERLVVVRGMSSSQRTYRFLERALPAGAILFAGLIYINSSNRGLVLVLCGIYVSTNVLMSWAISRLGEPLSRPGEWVKIAFGLVFVFVAIVHVDASACFWMLHFLPVFRSMLVLPGRMERLGAAAALGGSSAWAETVVGKSLGLALQPAVLLLVPALLIDALFRYFERQLLEERKRHRKVEHVRRLSSRLEAVGNLAAGLAHEINTPVQYVGDSLAFVRQGVERLLSDCRIQDEMLEELRERSVLPAFDSRLADDHRQTQAYLQENLPAAVDRADHGVARVAEIVKSMRVFSHPGSREQELADLEKVLRSTVTIASSAWKNVANFEFDLAGLPLVRCQPAELGQVFLNLLVNAIDAIREAERPNVGMIKVSTRLPADGWVEVSIEDDGCGMAANVEERVFDPFFTTKPVGRGTGQGLAIALEVVGNLHGGKIDLESVVGQGTVVRVMLPIKGKRRNR